MFRFLAILLLSCTIVHGQEKIWSAMILATDPERGVAAKAAPADLAPFAAKLTRIFGYQQFEILGSATKTMGAAEQERWLVPSPTFLVGAQARKEGAGFRISLDLFQDNRRLVQTEAKLGLQSPLFISGPKHGKGQLIIVFEIRP